MLDKVRLGASSLLGFSTSGEACKSRREFHSFNFLPKIGVSYFYCVEN